MARNMGKTTEDIARTFHISTKAASDIPTMPSFEHYIAFLKNNARQNYKNRQAFKLIKEKGTNMDNKLDNPFSENLGTPSEKVYTEYKPTRTGKGIPLPPLTQEEYQKLLDMTKRGMNKEEMARHMGARNAVQLFGRVKETREHELGFLSALDDSKRVRAERTMKIRNKNLEISPMRNGEFKSVYVKRKVSNKPKFINGMPASEFYKKNLEKARAAKKTKMDKTVKIEGDKELPKQLEVKLEKNNNVCSCKPEPKTCVCNSKVINLHLFSKTATTIMLSALMSDIILVLFTMFGQLELNKFVIATPLIVFFLVLAFNTLWVLSVARFINRNKLGRVYVSL